MQDAPSFSDQIHAVNDLTRSMLWLYDLPSWLFALLTVVVFVCFTLLGLLFLHRRINESRFAVLIDNGTVGWFFSGVTVLYGLLLGLLTVATWTSYTQASGLVSQEAANIAVLYRNISGYPDPARKQLQSHLRKYTQFIVQQSWPLQRRGMIHDGEEYHLLALQDTLMNYEPTTEGGKVIHQEAIRVFNSLVELRRLRAESISGSVPAVIWYVVILGAFLTLTFSYLFIVKDIVFQGILTSLLSAVIGLLIFLIAALDHPYWGEVSVSPTAYQLVLEKVMKP